MPFVLDASVTLSWYFDDESPEYAAGVLSRMRTDQAIAPSIWPMEVANALAMAQRSGRLSAINSRRAARSINRLPVAVHEVSVALALEVLFERAVTTGLTVYDSSYLELALHEGVALATLDSRLRAAAETVGVALVEYPA